MEELLANLAWLQSATGYTVAGLALIAVTATAFFQYKTNNLLGNHLMHAFGRQEDLLREISNKITPLPQPQVTVVVTPEKPIAKE